MVKTFVFGLDGADTYFIDKWISHLPNISSLINEGVYGILESTIPYSTLPAWPCFATSMNPGKLGFMGFTTKDESGRTNIVSSSLHKNNDVWTLLGEQKQKVIVINVPSTYPPYPLNGILVTGLLTPPGANYVYPSELRSELDNISGGYVIEPIITSPKEMKGGVEAFHNEVMQVFNKRLSVIKHLATNYDWDFYMIVFRVLDIIQHKFLNESYYNNENKQDYNSLLKDPIFMWYKKVDDSIGEILEILPKNTYKIFMSDHGCFPAYPTFYINEWLKEANFLSFKNNVDSKTSEKRDYKNIVRYIIIKTVPTKFLHWLIKYVPQNLTKKMKTAYMSTNNEKTYQDMIDWEKTTAYSSIDGGGGIYINSREDNKDEIIDKFYKKLDHIYHPNGKKIIFKKWKISEIYWGNKMKNFPDVYIKAYAVNDNNDIIGECRISGGLRGKLWGNTPHPGVHRREGMYLISGQNIKKNIRKNTGILNLTPTILKIYGVEIPDYMDGDVMEDIFINEDTI